MEIFGYNNSSNRRVRRRLGRRFEKRPSFEEATKYYNDKEFSIAFRMTRRNFEKRTKIFEHRLKKDESMASRCSGGAISPKVRLGINIRLLSGRILSDQVLIYKVAPSTIYSIFKEVVSVVNESLEFPSIPTDEEGLKKLAAGFKFSRRIPNPFNGCVAAIDVIAVK